MIGNAKCLALWSAVMMAPLAVAPPTTANAQTANAQSEKAQFADVVRNYKPTYLLMLPLSLDEFLAQHGGLTRLNLRFQNATASEIAQEVMRQSGVDVIANEDLLDNAQDAPRFTFEAKDQPFWAAMDQLDDDQRPLSIYRDRRAPNRWGLNQWGGDLNGRGQMFGPCYLMLNEIRPAENRSLHLTSLATPNAQAEPASLPINYSMLFDPKVADAIVGYEVQVDAATDEQGKALTPQKHWVMPVFPSQNQVSGTMLVEKPEIPIKKLRSLKGTIRLAVVTRTQAWGIDLTQKAAAQKNLDIGGSQKTLSVSDTSELNGLLQVTLSSTNGPEHTDRLFSNGEIGKPNLFLSNPNILQRRMRFFDERGHEIYATSSNPYTRVVNSPFTEGVNLTFNRLNPGDVEYKPVKIIFDVPTEWREVQVPFELKDVLLP